jgi:hypothetical protein
MDLDCVDREVVQLRNDHDTLEDQVMDVEMSAKGAHQVMVPLKQDVQDLNDMVANMSNQIESVQVEDIAWC